MEKRTDSRLLNALRERVVLADGATGSMLFELTGRLSERNHVYEALNIENPELVLQVHLSHLEAGAGALKTNTFAANETSLSRLGVEGQSEEINRAAVRLANDAIARFTAASGRGNVEQHGYFVLGSVGPASNLTSVESTYGPQLHGLIDEGVDALLLETFISLEHALAVVKLAKSIENCPPIILHMSLRQRRADGKWDIEPADYVTHAATAGVSVVGVNCLAPWEAEAFTRAANGTQEVQNGQILLSAMPNAGGFERIGHRFMSRVNAEFMGRCARSLADDGARLIGGCCEVFADHIREMHAYLRSSQAGPGVPEAALPSREPVKDEHKSSNGPFSKRLFAGEFVVSVEMLPPRGTGPRQLQTKIETVERLAAEGLADAVDVTDGSRGIPLMPPGDFIQAVRENTSMDNLSGQIEFIPHFTSRDLNLMAIQGRLIGYYTRNIHNVLFVTGDPPKMSPTYPRSTAVFDMDSVGMIERAHRFLNAGVDFGGQPLGRHAEPSTHFTVGTGFEPEAVDAEGELAKLRRKLDAGADYVMTQPVFDQHALEKLEPVRGRARFVVGVMVLTSLAHVERFAQVPGVRVPQEIFDRFARFSDVEDQRKCGLDLAVSQAEHVRSDGWSGLYLMSPASTDMAVEVLKSIGR